MVKDMVYDTMNFPFAEFGEGKTRKVRLIVSPETTGDEGLSLVYTTIPPGAVSEGHIHPDFDEYIFFDTGGRAILNGEVFEVPSKGLIRAKAGVKHECVNTSEDETLGLFCVFIPPLKPYGKYPLLIEETKKYLASKKQS
jgi:quercetin dioxygenase-like cupin family protein